MHVMLYADVVGNETWNICWQREKYPAEIKYIYEVLLQFSRRSILSECTLSCVRVE